MYKMVVVDDEYLVRTGICETVDWASHGVQIVGTAVNGKDGLQKIEQLQPDVVISDVKMPVMDGMELVRTLNERNYDGIVVVLSGYNEFSYAKSTLEMGVYKYILKPIDNDELVSTVLGAIKKLEQKRKTNLYMSDFNVGIPVIKNRLVDNLFRGDFDEKDIVQKMELYDLPVFYQGTVVYCKADVSSAGTDAQRDENVRNALAIAQKEVMHALLGAKVIYSQAETRFALACDVTDVDALEKVLIKALREYERQCKVLISIGVSTPFDGLNKISAAFGQAKFIAVNKLYVSINSVAVARGEEKRMYKKHIQDALSYISSHYADNDLKIRKVADELYVSESYLIHLFKQELNKTFNTCLTEYRIMTAKRLLLEQKYKVYEIAEMVGYVDMKYFGQVFRKLEGCTPSDYVRIQNEKKNS